MDVEAAELQDWEVLLPDPISADSGLGDSDESPKALEEIGADSVGTIHANYFSLGTRESYMGSVADVNVSEAGSEASDSPSWIDPRSEAGYPRKESGESWPDSGSDGSEDRTFEGKGEMGVLPKEPVREGFDGIQEIRCGCGKNDSGDGLKIEQFEESPGIEGDADLEAAGQKNESEAVESAWKKPDEVKRSRSVVWWKVPFDFLKYGVVFRSSPIWNFSVAAAAALGLAFLGQRLMYKMMLNKKKKKVKNLELNITVDDKKVSQFMSGATRLNEAFSMVKRVPVIRSQLPAAAVIPWPIIALV
ncbi:unnamed protein product [Cuscuta epithymum]|uniref:DUF6821 domain-containing protein n=1 Tax=Cuscuta epithymum TaxID=186058 RepID=A0AAV0E0K2_9ASTE|nr:unnamed protein product [Cuscuta epithymum]CAH9126717.1 unnamed protein product [Cuscuta epithymum]